jgi:hypothetical protein
MPNEPSILERFNRLPRAIRWLAIAVLFVALFQAWYYLLQPVAESWSRAADEMEEQIAAVREGSALAARFTRMNDTVSAIGPVMLPGDENQASQALTQAYVDVMNDYSVSNDSFDLRGTAGRVSDRGAAGLVRRGEQLRRITARLVFEASPEDAMAIISDLDRRPDVEGLSEVKLLRIGDRKLKVTLTLEAWAAMPRER